MQTLPSCHGVVPLLFESPQFQHIAGLGRSDGDDRVRPSPETRRRPGRAPRRDEVKEVTTLPVSAGKPPGPGTGARTASRPPVSNRAVLGRGVDVTVYTFFGGKGLGVKTRCLPFFLKGLHY